MTSRTLHASSLLAPALFMKASGSQLRDMAVLVDAGIIRPVIDSVFEFDLTLDALAFLEQGRTEAGTVVIRMP